MSNESVIEHRANYHYTQTREDFLAICCQGDCSPHCKALILSILESWTNTKRDKGDSDFVYMSIPQWVKYTYMCYERNTICDCLAELIAEKMIERRAITMYNQETFEYRLNVEVVQELLRALPDKNKYDVLPNLDAYMSYKEKRKATRGVREKSTTLESDEGVREKTHTVVDKSQGVREKSTRGYVKNQRNLESNTKLNLTSTKNVESVSLDAENTTPSLFPDLPPETKEIPIATKLPQWSATSCKAMFDEWRGFPLASSRVAKEKAKYLAGNFSREVVVAAHDYMSTNPWWKDRVGGDIVEVAKHMPMIMTQLGISDPKATIIEPKTNVIPFSQGQRKVVGGAPAQTFSESTQNSTEEMLTGLSPYMAKANRILKAAGLAPIC